MICLPSAADACKHSGWAVAASLHIHPVDNSALNDMHWHSSSGGSSSLGSGMHLTGLLAKAMPAPAAAVAAPAAGSELLYAIEWQAHSSSYGSAAPSMAAAHAASPLWQLGGRTVAVAGQRHSCSDASFAAAHLAVMQTVRRGLS